MKKIIGISLSVIVGLILTIYSVFWFYQASSIEKSLKTFLLYGNQTFEEKGFNISVKDARVTGFFSLGFRIKFKDFRLDLEEKVKPASLVLQDDDNAVRVEKLNFYLPIFANVIELNFPSEVKYFGNITSFFDEDNTLRIGLNDSAFVNFLKGCNLSCIFSPDELKRFDLITFAHNGYLNKSLDGMDLSKSDQGFLEVKNKKTIRGQQVSIEMKGSGNEFFEEYYINLRSQVNEAFRNDEQNKNALLKLVNYFDQNNDATKSTEYSVSLTYEGPVKVESFANGRADIIFNIDKLTFQNYLFSINLQADFEVSDTNPMPNSEGFIAIDNVANFGTYVSGIYNILTEMDLERFFKSNKLNAPKLDLAKIYQDDVDDFIEYAQKLSFNDEQSANLNLDYSIQDGRVRIGDFSLGEAISLYLNYFGN